jgi:hypothetical protein
VYVRLVRTAEPTCLAGPAPTMNLYDDDGISLGGMLPAMAWPTVIGSVFCNVWLFVTPIAKKVSKQENHCEIAESLGC